MENVKSVIKQFYVKLIQYLITVLSAMTRTGVCYKLDTRLRPSGSAGVLVTPLNNYQEYHKTSKPWEHQALIKGRVVAGDLDEDWRQQVQNILHSSVYKWELPTGMKEQIHHLRSRKEAELSGESERKRNLKEGRGGILDIEFLVQYLQLRHGRNYASLQVAETLVALQQLGEHNLLKQSYANKLIESYKFLRHIENYLRLLYDESTNMLDFDQTQEEAILKLLNRHGYEYKEVIPAVESITESVRCIYSEVMES